MTAFVLTLRIVGTALLLWTLTGCGASAPAPARQADEAHAHAEAEDEHAHGAAADEQAGHVEQTTISAEQARAAGIISAPAVAGTIADEHEVQGLLAPIDGRSAQLTARFPGPIRALRANVGDRVRAGQSLASIESNLSLTTYSVAAPISGMVLSRLAQVGGVAAEGQLLYEIGDLSQLWVDLHIFGADTQHITAGVPVTITRMTDGVSQATILERVLPGTATASQSTVARAIIGNDDGLWRPGAAVRARIVVASTPAAVVVPLTALQNMAGKDVVFVQQGDVYAAREVMTGNRDAHQVAITEGLQAGEQVVVEQSYTVKADIGKAGAAHEH